MEQADVHRFMLRAAVHTFCRFAVWLLSPILYIWTLYLAYLTSFAAVLVAMFIPIGPQLYFIWVLWNATGTLSNLYTLLCLAWVVLALIGILARIKAETVGS